MKFIKYGTILIQLTFRKFFYYIFSYKDMVLRLSTNHHKKKKKKKKDKYVDIAKYLSSDTIHCINNIVVEI